MSRTLLLALLLALSARVYAQDPNAGRALAATCANCHGTNGHAVGGMPVLAGRPRAELARVMRDFRDGRRPATIMNQLAKGFTDGQIEALSAYLSSQTSR
jgi:cytochrome subunit of sulfide dehydrogenase